MRIVAFLGPSLPAGEARVLVANELDVRPPARKGDFYRLLATDVDTIVLVDGVFHGEPSVWPREIADALDEGIRVIGASSMGALRGAELAPYGMEGVGTVFGWYADGLIDGDDEVALRHADAEHGWRALSEPLVNVRATLARAEVEGIVSAARGADLLARAKAMHYPQRAWASIAEGDVALARALVGIRVDIKRADARLAFQRAAELTPGRRAGAPGAAADLFDRERLSYRVLHEPTGATGATLLERATASGLAASLRPELARRWFVDAWADEAGVPARAPAASSPRIAGLTVREAAREQARRARREEIEARGPGAFGIESFADDWARRRGIPVRGEALVRLGPEHFGHGPPEWDPTLELLRELLVGGHVAALAESP